MVRNARSLARRLGSGSLVLIGASLLGTCKVDNVVDPPLGGRLAVSPLRLADSAALGSRAVRVVSVTISNAAAGDLVWTARRLGASPWLSLGAASGTAPSTLTAVADPRGLAAGVYEDTIVVTATSPARGEARIAIQFAIHPCAVGPISLDGDVAGRLDGADCTAPHRDATFADLYSFTGSAGDSVSVELESDEFTPYLILDTTTTTSVPPLATSGSCAYVPARPCLRYQRLPRSGTFVIEATTAVAGDSGAYRLRLFRPRFPSPVDSLTQLRGDSTTPIVTGGMTADAAIVLRGTASDPDGGDSLRLEVEVRPVDEAFLGAATSTGALVPAGGRAFARVNGLSDNTAFHWRARVVDQTGRASAWTGYGDNPEFAADLGVAIADGPTAPAGLGQFKSDSLAAIAVGGMTDERAAVFKGTVLDPDPGDRVRLDVEIQVVGTPFSGAPSASSGLVASGGVGTVAITGLVDNTSYHWQARTVDQSGRASAWAEFGDNLAVAPDLHVRVAPTQLVFTVHPGTTGSGTAIAPAVQVAAQDGEGNTLASFTGPVSIALGNNAAGGTLAGTQTVNAVAGVATFADLWIDRAGTAYTLVASATGPAPATSAAFGITPGPAVRLAIMTQPPGTAASGVAFGQQPVLQLLDAAGNAVSHDGVAVEAAIASGGGTLGGTTTVLTDASGVAVFTDLMITGPVGPRTLQFDATGLTGVSSTVELIAGPPSQMSIQAGDDQVDTVSRTLPTALAVRVVDQFNNPVSNVQISWAVLDGGGSVNPLSALTDANGIATTSWTLGTTMTPTDSVQQVQATGAGLPLTFTAFTVPGPVSASQTSVTAFPATITASSGSSASTLTITVRDQFGNVIKDKPVVFSATGTGNALTQPTTTTNASGVATGSLSATEAGDKFVSATVGGTAVTQSAAVAVTPAGVSAAQSTVTTASGTITASSGASSTTITVTARDPFGNLIEGATVVLAATGTGNALTQPGTTTDASGVATGSLSATEAGDKVVSASINGTGITQTATVTVTATAVDGALSTVAAAPGSITASNGASSATITVTARDQFGNPIEGATVVLTATGSGNTLTQPAGSTDASGAVTGTLSSTAAETKTVSATINGTGIAQTPTVMVAAAAVNAAQSTVAIAPATITASTGASSAAITVTARDQFDNPIEGAAVVLTATGDGNTVTQPATTTDANGVATGSLSATVAGDKIVSATIGGTGITQTASVTVTSAGVSAALSTVAAAPGSITAGTEIATITVTARDGFGNPIEGAAVVLAATGSGNTLTQSATTTDANGVATGSLSTTGAGDKVVSATINATAISQTATVTVMTAAVDAVLSTVAAAPGSITASNGASSATITVTARDLFGNPIEGATVVLAATGAGDALTQPATTTNASGVATGTLSSTGVGDKVVSATIAGTAVTQTAVVSVIPAEVSAGQSIVAAAPGSISAGNGVATITVTARDPFGNPIEGAAVVLATTGSGNTLTQPGTTTNASGIATGTLSATVAEAKIVSATINGTAIAQTAAVTVIPDEVSAAQSTVSAAPGSITAGSGVATITVTARDPSGNPIEGATVVLTATGSGNTLTQPLGPTSASGVATGLLSATAAGNKVVSAAIAGVAVTQTAAVTVVAAEVDAAQSTVAVAPATIVSSNGASSTTITVTARDAFGNPIEGATAVLAASGSGNTLTQPLGPTTANGVATGSLSATVAEGKTVSVTIDGTDVTQTATVTVSTAGVDAVQSTVAVAPASITASTGASSAAITVTAKDQFGNPIEGAAVVLAATGSGNTLTQPATTSDANGVATGSLSATGAGDKIVSATIGGTGITQTATVTVTTAAVSPEQSTLTAAPGTITAGTEIATFTVTARDPFGNPIEGATVVLAATGAGNALTQPATTTNASGVATGTLSATGAGDKVVSATIGGTGITQTATVTVTPAGVSAALSTVAAAPGSITAGSGVATITVTARDPFGNPIEGAAVVLATTGSGNTLTQPGTTTNASGITTGTLSATTAEAKIVSATINGTAITQTAAVTVIPDQVSAAQSTVSAAPGSITAGSGVATITVTARDPSGNPIEGATVVLTATGSGNTLTQPLGPTSASGVATGLLSATAAGNKVVSATIAGTGITQTALVTVTPADVSAAQSTVIVAPEAITAGSDVATITVAARDAFGNAIAGTTAVLTVTGSGNTLTQPATTTDANGQATGTLSSTAAGDKVVSATIAGTGVTQTATVNVTAAGVSAAQSTVAASPGSITAGSGVATITVTARDAFGNPIDDATVSLAATGTGNTLTQPHATNANGVTTGTLSATGAGERVVSATIEVTGITQTATVTVTPAGVSAAQSTVAATPGTITASSGASSTTITVTARDAFGNPIAGATVVLAATGTGNVLTQPTTATNANGVATGAFSATVAEAKTVSVTIDGTGITQPATVTVTPDVVSAAQSTVSAAPGTITASGGASSATITITARDQFDNPIEGAAVLLAATGTGNTVTQPATTTSASGVATGTLSATGAGDKVVSVTIGGTGITQTATVTVTPASVSAAQSTVTAAPGAITASSGASSAAITVTARDQFGNPIEGAAVVLVATGTGNTLTQPAMTNASGVTTGTLSAIGAGDKEVSATIAGTAVTQTAAVTVTPAGVSATQSTVAASPGTITVGSGVSTITVTARDAFGNPIEGATVELAATGTGNTLTQPGATTADGVATGMLSATVAEGKTVSVTIDGTAVTQTAAVTVTATDVSPVQSMVVAAPTTITASNGASSTTITVTARDQFDNPIEGAEVLLTATGTGNTVTQPTTTDASGVATGTLSATGAGNKVVSATINGTGITQTATVTVTPAGVSAVQSTVSAAPGAIMAGSGVATIAVTARDAFGNPVEGATVLLAATGDGNTLTQPGTATDASGVATATLSATVAQGKTVSVTIDGTGITQTATVTVIPAGVSTALSTVTAAPGTITASSGSSSATITVTARDQFGNLIDGATVVLSASGDGNTLTQPPGPTSGGGVAVGSLSATGAEGKTVSVTIDGTAITQTAAVTVVAAGVSAVQSTVAASPGTITVGTGVATITVTARDAFGNPIEGAAVELAATGTGNTLTQPGTTNANGVATGTLSATTAEDKVVSATIGETAVTQAATVTVTAAGVSAAQSTVASSPGSITAGSGVATITVTARDGFGNPVEGVTVVLAATGSGNSLTQPGTPTDASGVATGTLSATAAEAKTVTATADGVAITQHASVLVNPAVADHLVFLVPPTSATAGATMTPPVEVEIRDQFSNRVTGATNAVALTIATNPGGATLTGGDPVAAVNGVASFASLSVDKSGMGYTLAASSPGLTGATSSAFTVTAGALSAAQSTVVAAPASIPVGSGVATITVTAKDANDNPIEGAAVALAVTGSATVLTQPAGLTAADGTATGTLSATLSGPKVVAAVINGTPIVQTASVTVQPPLGSVVFVGAGDIGDCEWTTDEATATLLDGIAGTVFTAGDNAYPNGTASDFTNCYEPTWGRHKARTYPSPGNHDYRTSGAADYFAYFGANAGPAGRGYYSFDLGDWHLISLNSEISMSTSSAQVQWLRADLAANTKQCTLAYWHKPLFSSGDHGSLVGSKPLWKALQEYNAEVVVVGHDHNYERFAPQDTLGVADPARGLRQFVVGTGGTDLRSMNPPIANSEVQNSNTHGVLKLTLHGSGYEWEFIPVAGKTFTDVGSGSCH